MIGDVRNQPAHMIIFAPKYAVRRLRYVVLIAKSFSGLGGATPLPIHHRVLNADIRSVGDEGTDFNAQ